MRSSMPALARPARTVAKSRLTAPSALSIRSSSCFKISLVICGSPLNNCADFFAQNSAFDVAFFRDVEDDDRDLVVHAQGDRGRIHHAKALVQHIHIGEL